MIDGLLGWMCVAWRIYHNILEARRKKQDTV
jgi:hypothetical protein